VPAKKRSKKTEVKTDLNEADGDVVKKAKNGLFYEIWMFIGNGGGHSLSVRDLIIKIELEPHNL